MKAISLLNRIIRSPIALSAVVLIIVGGFFFFRYNSLRSDYKDQLLATEKERVQVKELILDNEKLRRETDILLAQLTVLSQDTARYKEAVRRSSNITSELIIEMDKQSGLVSQPPSIDSLKKARNK